MRQHVEVSATHPHGNADKAFSILQELDRHVVTGDVIRSLSVDPLGEDLRVSHWDVKFRNGILRWSQRDQFDAATHTMRFELVDGDAEVLEGTWRMEDRGEGCVITFSCEFDLGIPSLAEFLDPVAVRILGETVIAQLTEIFGPELDFDRAAEAARG